MWANPSQARAWRIGLIRDLGLALRTLTLNELEYPVPAAGHTVLVLNRRHRRGAWLEYLSREIGIRLATRPLLSFSIWLKRFDMVGGGNFARRKLLLCCARALSRVRVNEIKKKYLPPATPPPPDPDYNPRYQIGELSDGETRHGIALPTSRT